MKILPVSINSSYNLLTPRINQPHADSKNISDLRSNSEIIGRSLVNFRGATFTLDENDEKFIDVTSRDLRLNGKERAKFKKDTKLFLQRYMLKSTDDMNTKDPIQDDYIQNRYINYVRRDLDLSVMDGNIILCNLLEKFDVYNQENYNPVHKPYVKDAELFKFVFDKWKIKDDNKQLKIYRAMCNEAQNNNCETLFDIFKPPQKPSKEFMELMLSVCKENAYSDICVDFFKIAQMNQKARKNFLPGTEENKNNKYVSIHNKVDRDVCGAITRAFDIDVSDDDLLNLIRMRWQENTGYREIAFYILDKYSLPTQSYGEIVEILKLCDEYEQYLIFKDESNPED